MFGIGMTEVAIILLVALVFIGPEKLPKVARTLGKGMRELRRASDDIRSTIMLDDDDNRYRSPPPPPRTIPSPQDDAHDEAHPDDAHPDEASAAIAGSLLAGHSIDDAAFNDAAVDDAEFSEVPTCADHNDLQASQNDAPPLTVGRGETSAAVTDAGKTRSENAKPELGNAPQANDIQPAGLHVAQGLALEKQAGARQQDEPDLDDNSNATDSVEDRVSAKEPV